MRLVLLRSTLVISKCLNYFSVDVCQAGDRIAGKAYRKFDNRFQRYRSNRITVPMFTNFSAKNFKSWSLGIGV